MAIAVVSSVSKGSTDGNGTTTAAITTTGANLLIALVASYQPSGDQTVSDSKSNSWNPLTTYSHSGFQQLKFYYSVAPSNKVGTLHTFSVGAAATYPSICVLALSGAHATTPADQENGHEDTGGTTGTPGSVTPTEDNEILVTGSCTGASEQNASSISLSYTIVENIIKGATYESCALAYLIQTTAAAKNPTWTFDTTINFSICNHATFKAAAAGGPAFTATTRELTLLGVGA